jgi:hypothetical protein
MEGDMPRRPSPYAPCFGVQLLTLTLRILAIRCLVPTGSLALHGMVGVRVRFSRALRRTRAVPAIISVLCWLAVVEVGVRVLPLSRLGNLIGVPVSTAEDPPSSTVSPKVQLRPAELRRLRTLAKIAPHWPFCDGPCLRESLVAGRVLRHRKPRLRLGVAASHDEFMAHAWLEVEGLGRLGWVDSFLPFVHHRVP